MRPEERGAVSQVKRRTEVIPDRRKSINKVLGWEGAWHFRVTKRQPLIAGAQREEEEKDIDKGKKVS